MDSPSNERIERLEKQVMRAETRLEVIEKTVQEIIVLLRKQGIERSRNYDAP